MWCERSGKRLVRYLFIERLPLKWNHPINQKRWEQRGEETGWKKGKKWKMENPILLKVRVFFILSISNAVVIPFSISPYTEWRLSLLLSSFGKINLETGVTFDRAICPSYNHIRRMPRQRQNMKIHEDLPWLSSSHLNESECRLLFSSPTPDTFSFYDHLMFLFIPTFLLCHY